MSDASNATLPAVIDIVDDGLTDEEIAAQTRAWLREVMATLGVEVGESAANSLDDLERNGDLWRS